MPLDRGVDLSFSLRKAAAAAPAEPHKPHKDGKRTGPQGTGRRDDRAAGGAEIAASIRDGSALAAPHPAIAFASPLPEDPARALHRHRDLVFFVDGGGRRARRREKAEELKARTHFAAGEYQQALDIYARLYAETMHPTYLRNIARCHQNLGNADKAISSFREYLRKAKDLSPEQRAEIEGYIEEMEQLKRSKPARQRPAPAPAQGAPARGDAAAGADPGAGRHADGDRGGDARRRRARSTRAGGSGGWWPAWPRPASSPPCCSRGDSMKRSRPAAWEG